MEVSWPLPPPPPCGMGDPGKKRRRIGGNISDAAPHAGLARHAQPGPVLYTPRVNKMSLARRIALALLSPYARPGGPFSMLFSPISGLFRRDFARRPEWRCDRANIGRVSTRQA
jgi:hypothetical protein